MKPYAFGIDIGGTTVKCGFFNSDGTFVEKWEIPTRKEDDGAMILPDIAEAIKAKLAEHGVSMDDVEGIGVGVPGPVLDDGVVNGCVNLGWGVFNVAEKLSGLLGGVPVQVGNDANVAALGEQWHGDPGYRCRRRNHHRRQDPGRQPRCRRRDRPHPDAQKRDSSLRLRQEGLP